MCTIMLEFLYVINSSRDPLSKYHAKQKHLGVKQCGANQKQHCKQAGATKRSDIS